MEMALLNSWYDPIADVPGCGHRKTMQEHIHFFSYHQKPYTLGSASKSNQYPCHGLCDGGYEDADSRSPSSLSWAWQALVGRSHDGLSMISHMPTPSLPS